jgi:hypothetical protein
VKNICYSKKYLEKNKPDFIFQSVNTVANLISDNTIRTLYAVTDVKSKVNRIPKRNTNVKEEKIFKTAI